MANIKIINTQIDEKEEIKKLILNKARKKKF